jgi:hypothetical protein
MQQPWGLATISLPSGDTRTLAMKAAVETGRVRRFLVGDPRIQVIEVLAGATLDRLSAAEHQASRGEVILAPGASTSLAAQVKFARWQEQGIDWRFGVVESLDRPVEPRPWPSIAPGRLAEGAGPALAPASRLRKTTKRGWASSRPSSARW